MSTLVATGANGYDRMRDLKAFDKSKSGVKGLVDAGISEIPRIFHQKPEDVYNKSQRSGAAIPVIDLEGVGKDPIRSRRVTDLIRDASERWGVFQVVNHGIPVHILEEMKEGVRRFNEQDEQVKKEYYTRDSTRKLVYNSNPDLYTASAANWRDTFFCYMAPTPPQPEDLPEACRDILMEYSDQVKNLGHLLFKILSESLGLGPDRLKEMDCAEALAVICHYHPPCPQPELAIGANKHTDNNFLTVLLQDQIGGLQVLVDEGEWFDVAPIPGALVVNIGDLLQVVTNKKFKSVEHRVLANKTGPRTSVACFFTKCFQPSEDLLGPIKELLSEDSPPLYKETTMTDYLTYFEDQSPDGAPPLFFCDSVIDSLAIPDIKS